MNFFGTGGQQSGTGVLRPVKKPDEEDPDFLEKLMELQQQQGMQAQGDLDDAIYLYRNGFKIGDGPFQPDTNPENKKFLTELKSGHIPKQLESTLRQKLGPNANTLGVKVIDKQNQDYEPPIEEKTKFEAFQGTGHSLNDNNNNKQINVSLESIEGKELPYDDKDESTKIQVILYNGKRETVTVNLKSTILELYAHIRYISNYDGKFQLLAGFPPQPLDNPSQTIREAQLQGARVTQKPLK